MQKGGLARGGHIQTYPTLYFLLSLHVRPAVGHRMQPLPQPCWGSEQPHHWQTSAPLPPPTFPAWPCLDPVLQMCVFPALSSCTPGTELQHGGATHAFSIDQVIFYLFSFRHEVCALAALVCLYLSVHVFPSFSLLAISIPICHIELHLAEGLRFADITFLEGFWRRNITLNLLWRQKAAEMYLEVRVCQGTRALPRPTCKGWTNEMKERNTGHWSGRGFRGCKYLGTALLQYIYSEWFLWGTWVICMCYVQMQLDTLQVAACKMI